MTGSLRLGDRRSMFPVANDIPSGRRASDTRFLRQKKVEKVSIDDTGVRE